jgi:hypothetical protein
MPPVALRDLVRFRGDRLFNGAVNLSWFWNDVEKSHQAAEAYVFHGPQYHGVQQSDIGISHEHHLQDTATFLKNIIKKCYGEIDQSFTLAIAGYGTGKSHLALTIANLLSNPDSEIAKTIISNVEISDESIGKEIKLKFLESNKPCLVVALNGMQNFDLTSEVFKQIYRQITNKNIDTTPLDDLRPRFINAIKVLNVLNDSLKDKVKKHCDTMDFEKIIECLKNQDEHIYKQVYDFLSSYGFPIQAMGGESLEDIITTVADEYCGENKPFQSLIILFDEFGRFTEFATTNSQIAGSGVLQSLYEGIQNNNAKVSFIGFIQFELNAYLQRIAPEYKNDIIRFITRYQSSNKVYLSVNLETLLANLIQKIDNDKVDSLFENELSLKKSEEILKIINKWFLQSRNHRLWSSVDQFHKIISKGCWPLSPFSTWFLYHLTASGKHLQERSALALLGEVFSRYSAHNITNLDNWYLYPADLWTKELEQEFLGSEDLGQQGSITQSYMTVIDRYNERFSEASKKLLRTIVLSSKMGVNVESQDEAVLALSKLAGLAEIQVKQEIELLQNDYNVIEWDETVKFYDILGDSASRAQFLSFLRQKVVSHYNEESKARLFMGKAATWFDLLKDLDCDFADENQITTKDWYFKGITSDLEMLNNNIIVAANYWEKAIAIDDPKGTIVYCYINQNYDLKDISNKVKKQLIQISHERKVSALPIIVVFLYDENGKLGQYLAEYSILHEHINNEDVERFGNLVKVYKEKIYTIIQNQIETMLKERHYITPLSEETKSTRLKGLASELFKNIYSNILQFPFDGFSTSRGNAANTNFRLTRDLFLGSFDYNKILGYPVQEKNRSLTVLKNHWEIFNKNGSISRKPGNPVVRMIIEDWNNKLNSDEISFNIGNEIINKTKPPYGANIASASLLFAVFVAPRIDNLIIQENGQQFAISQLVENDDIFQGKFLNIKRLKNMELEIIGDESASEWQNLLDEWEHSDYNRDKVTFFLKAQKLKSRIPIPNNLIYRYENLCLQSRKAEQEIKKIEDDINSELIRIERALEKGNIGKVSRGAAELLDLQKKMESEIPSWTEREINEFKPHIERARQLIIQDFSNWLSRQVPRGENPDQLGDFKHYLLNLVGGNLKKLGLEDFYQEIEIKVRSLTELAEVSAQAKQLDRDIQSFLQMDEESLYKVLRLAKIRGLQKTANEYISKSTELPPDVTVNILNESISNLYKFINKLKETEKEIMDRAIALWDSSIDSIQKIESMQIQISELIQIFEGCETDLEDLNSMNKAVKMFKQFYTKLDDELTWEQFETISKNMKKVIKESFDEDEIPWPIDAILTSLYEEIKNKRISRSLAWLNDIKKEFSKINSMTTSEASQFHSKINKLPLFVTAQHLEEVKKINHQVEEHLNKMAIEWLIERFKELPESSKEKFLNLARQIIEREYSNK